MIDDANKIIQEENAEEIIKFPDVVEMWKDIYFKTEESWADSVKEIITSQTFASFINQTREQYLNYEKVSRQSMDKFFENNPIPSKKDISRVAELIISLEDKVDDFEYHFTTNLNSMATSLIKFVDYQQNFREEIFDLKADVNGMNEKIDKIMEKLNSINIESKTATKTTNNTELSNTSKKPRARKNITKKKEDEA